MGLFSLETNVLGKMLIASLAAYVAGKGTGMILKGSKSQIEAIAKALQSSRVFQQELNKSGASVQSVIEKMNVKNMSASEFERVFGVKWPL